MSNEKPVINVTIRKHEFEIPEGFNILKAGTCENGYQIVLEKTETLEGQLADQERLVSLAVFFDKNGVEAFRVETVHPWTTVAADLAAAGLTRGVGIRREY